jgi:hypothetical protein
MNTGLLVRSTLLAILLLAGCKSGDGNGVTGAGSENGGSGAVAGGECPPSTEVTFPIPESPLLTLDSLGPLSDVTCEWQHYQPAEEFCVKPDAPEFTPGGTGPLTADGNDPECRFSGFEPGDTDLYKVQIETPLLCAGCRRYFIDMSQIPEGQSLGHAFYVLASFNPTYTIDPIAHSPNTKNFTNDHLVSPPGTPIATVVTALDTYAKEYVTHTTKFAHTAIQGPYYIGPWYVNREGERIHGLYLDVNVGDAFDLGDPNLNAIRYIAGYNSGVCPDSLAGLAGLNFLYAGCADHPGTSAIALNPFP